nr:B3 domain-containing protein At5g57720-like isoform X1 [Ipomoea batatas]
MRNRMKKVWNIEITKIGDAYFFKNGWAKFVEDNSFIDGDQLFFIYDHPAMFDFFVQNSFGCEKIIIEGKEAQFLNLGGLKRAASPKKGNVGAGENDVRAKKRDVSEEENDARAKKRDVSEEVNDARAKKRDVSEEENDARTKKRDVSEEENDASAEKVDASAEKNDANVKKKKFVPDHFGVELFSSGHFTQPKNPYFVTKIRPKRRDDLYIPIEVTRDNNIKLPAKVILWDEKDKKYDAYLKTWSDGRTWLAGGWRKLCKWNLVQVNDRCICEFVPSLGPELILKVTIIRRKDFEAAQPN